MNARQSAVCGWEWQRVRGETGWDRVTGAVGLRATGYRLRAAGMGGVVGRRGGARLGARRAASGFRAGAQRVEKKPMAVQAMAMAAAMRDSPAMKPEAVGTA